MLQKIIERPRTGRDGKTKIEEGFESLARSIAVDACDIVVGLPCKAIVNVRVISFL